MKDAPPASGRLAFIDGLRGVAILLVLLIHIWNRTGRLCNSWWNPAPSGYIGVDLFLILSGFCLYWPMARPGGKEPSLIEFARRRARRILPPYYIALALCCAGALLMPCIGHTWPEAGDLSREQTLTTTLWHVVMLHNLRPDHISALNGPFWSLALETSLYVAMPLLVIVARRGVLRAVALAAVETLAYRIWLNHYIGGASAWGLVSGNDAFVLCWSLPGKWLEFALGMWAAEILARGKNRIPRGLLALLAGGSVAGGACAARILGNYHPVCDLLFGSGLFCFVLAAAPSSLRSTARLQLMESRPLMFLGAISYSVYLIHLPLLNLALRIPFVDALSGMSKVAACVLLIMPAILALSYAFHAAFERPFMNHPPARRSAGHGAQ